MKGFIKKIDAKIYTVKCKAKEFVINKKDGFFTVELAILILIGVVLAGIFYAYIHDMTNSIMKGAQERTDALYQ